MFWYSNQQCQLGETGPLQCLAVIHSGWRETPASCVGAHRPPPEAHAYRLIDTLGCRWLRVTASSRVMFTPHLAPVKTSWTAHTLLTFSPIWCTTSKVTQEISQNHWNIFRALIWVSSVCRRYVLMIKSQKQDTPKHLRSFLIIITFSSIFTTFLHTTEPQRRFCWIRSWMWKNREILHTFNPSYTIYHLSPEPSTVNKWKRK